MSQGRPLLFLSPTDTPARGFHIDWTLLGCALGTVLTGILMVHSTEGQGVGLLTRQAIAAGIGIVAMVFLMLLPYQVFRAYVKPLYGVMIALLIGVLVFGVTLRGTRGWFHLGPIFFQPSELAKIIFVLTMAGYLDRRIDWYSPKSLVVPGVLAFVPIALILAEPDFSSSLVFFPVTLVMFYVAGVRLRHLTAILVVGVIAGVLPLLATYIDLLPAEDLRGRPILHFLGRALSGHAEAIWLGAAVLGLLWGGWWFLREMRFPIPIHYVVISMLLLCAGVAGAVACKKAIKDYQRRRLIAFVNPELDPLRGGYNVRQSQIAIGSGRLIGKGYGRGTQSRLGFLPSRNTDFIFSVIGEETGFLGALTVLLLYFGIIWRGFGIAAVSRDRFGSLVASGYAAMFGFYALLNVGMTMGMAPVAGVPLPLVSYGGSSVLSSLMAIGILLSIYWRRYLL